jgi:hypothetical protein
MRGWRLERTAGSPDRMGRQTHSRRERVHLGNAPVGSARSCRVRGRVSVVECARPLGPWRFGCGAARAHFTPVRVQSGSRRRCAMAGRGGLPHCQKLRQCHGASAGGVRMRPEGTPTAVVASPGRSRLASTGVFILVQSLVCQESLSVAMLLGPAVGLSRLCYDRLRLLLAD